MPYEFPIDIQDLVSARLREGGYTNEDDVLRDALAALDQIEQDKLARWESRNQLAIEQSAQGLAKPLDDATVLRRLRERLASEGIFG